MSDIKITAGLTDTVSPALKKMTDNAKQAQKNISAGNAQLSQGFQALTQEVTGVTGGMGQLGLAVGKFAGGGLLVTGVLAGISLLTIAWNKHKEVIADTKKANDDLFTAQQNYLKLVNPQQANINELNRIQGEYNKELETFNKLTAAKQAAQSGEVRFGSSGLPVSPLTFSADDERRLEASRARLTTFGFQMNSIGQQVLITNQKNLDSAGKLATEAQKEADARERAYRATWSTTKEFQEQLRIEQLKGRLDPQDLRLEDGTPPGFVTPGQRKLTDFRTSDEIARQDLTAQINANLTTSLQDLPGIISSLPDPLAQMRDTLDEIGKTQFIQDLKGNVIQDAVMNMSDGFINMFTAIGQGKPVFKALGDMIISTVARTARVNAMEQLAKGFAALALGPLGSKQAALHFKSAALFTAVAGVAGAIGGGGSFSNPASGQGFAQSQQDVFSNAAVNVTIVGGAIDFTNPSHLKSLQDGLGTLTGRRLNIIAA